MSAEVELVGAFRTPTKSGCVHCIGQLQAAGIAVSRVLADPERAHQQGRSTSGSSLVRWFVLLGGITGIITPS